MGKILGYNAGQASGLTAGALTQSAVIGVAQDAISNLSMDAADKKSMMDFVPVGYAVTYIFGTIDCAFILATVGPKILGVDLEEENKKLDNRSKDKLESSLENSRAGDLDYRAYIISDKYVGQSVSTIEKIWHKIVFVYSLFELNATIKCSSRPVMRSFKKMIMLPSPLKNELLRKLTY